jgi:hypothetical protein
MPYCKDIRCGEGWFEVNVNSFYDYLENLDEELIVSDDFCESEVIYHRLELEEKIEEAVNEFIRWKVFNDESSPLDKDDLPPSFFEPHSSIETGSRGIWVYVYHHICLFIRRKPTWYTLRSTLPEEGSESE